MNLWYAHELSWSLYPTFSLWCFSHRENYQVLHACTTSMFAFQSVGAWEQVLSFNMKAVFLKGDVAKTLLCVHAYLWTQHHL